MVLLKVTAHKTLKLLTLPLMGLLLAACGGGGDAADSGVDAADFELVVEMVFLIKLQRWHFLCAGPLLELSAPSIRVLRQDRHALVLLRQLLILPPFKPCDDVCMEGCSHLSFCPIEPIADDADGSAMPTSKEFLL